MNSPIHFRLCPKCKTRRQVSEPVCQMQIGQVLCAWDLSEVDIQDGSDEAEQPRPQVLNSPVFRCPNGHEIVEGDLICADCGADIVLHSEGERQSLVQPLPEKSVEIVPGWIAITALPSKDEVRRRYRASRVCDGRSGLLTVYRAGSQPDSLVYAALQNRVPREHIVELIEFGEVSGEYFDVTELIEYGSLAEMHFSLPDFGALHRIVEELSTALASFMEVGLRHRTLHPEKILIRCKDPLDLVVTGFESGRLSEADLETESLLDISRYTAPEAVMGAVTSASDWWGLGMILLGIVTQNRCFAGATDQLFLIHVQANGVSIPEGTDDRFATLLRGLLTIDRTKRWQWKEVREWLAGESPPVFDIGQKQVEVPEGQSIALANLRLSDPRRFAIEASRASNWIEACDLLTHGQIGLWAEELNLDGMTVSGLRQLGRMATPEVGLRLGLSLQLLNPHLPLIYSEEIVTPAWLLSHPDQGYALISSFLPEMVEQHGLDSDYWLLRLSRRATTIRARADLHEIELDEDRFRILVLSSSTPLLARQWEKRRNDLPDSSHPSLASLMERDHHSDEDLILLLSASVGQFYPASEIIAKASELATQLGLSFQSKQAASQLLRPRRELYFAVDDRIKGFARCNHSRLDAWADHFRMERRLPLPEVLLLLDSPTESWQSLQNQDYIGSVLGFFEKKVATSTSRGPLVRMTIGKTTPRVDFRELTQDVESAAALLANLLQRSDKVYALDPRILLNEEGPERRIRSLLNRTTQYLRDTGINGAYIGFPFLHLRTTNARTKPRLAPILLWPVKLSGEIGTRSKFSLTFDRERGGTTINPAFESLFGLETTTQWRSVADELLSRSSITLAEVVDAFGSMAVPAGRALSRLPKLDASQASEADQIICSAVLFHLEFTGQSLVEDIRQLKQRPVNETPLETMLRIPEASTASSKSFAGDFTPENHVVSNLCLVTESDPSQEEAITRAVSTGGLVVQGPPGTGKSQTIVNLVAHSISQRKRVLIVCQKLPALEVVQKRLVAENLGNRLVMLTNITSARRPLLVDIRSQLEGLQQGNTRAAEQLEQETRLLEVQIRKLEQDIDRNNSSFYELDPISGRTYRQILAELIAIEDAVFMPIHDVAALRMLFRGGSQSELIECEEACSSLAEDWFAAHFEDSPLSDTEPFAHDQASARELQRLLEVFAKAEQERTSIQQPDDMRHGRDCPEGLESWLDANEEYFCQWSGDSLPLASSLIPQFRQEGHAAEYAELLERRRNLLSSGCSLSGFSPQFTKWIARFDERESHWIADECAAHISLWRSARYENSPLAIVRITSADEGECDSFRLRVRQLELVENERLECVKSHGLLPFVESPDALEQWLSTSGQLILNAIRVLGSWTTKLLSLEEDGSLCQEYEETMRAWHELSPSIPMYAGNLHELEQKLASCDDSEVTQVIEGCSTVIESWIQEPLDPLLLSALAKFPQNQLECLAVEDSFQHFIRAELRRDALFTATPQPMVLNAIEPLRRWLANSEEVLAQAYEVAYEDASRWRPLFQSAASAVSQAQEMRQHLTEWIERISQFNQVSVDRRYSEKLSTLDLSALEEASSLVQRVKDTPRGLLELRRRIAAWPLNRWLRSRGMPNTTTDIQPLDIAVQQEVERRRTIQEINQVVRKLDLTIQPADWSGISEQSRQVSERLVGAFQICKVISTCPDNLSKSLLLRHKSKAVVLETLEAIRRSLEIHDAVVDSQNALQRLQPVVSITWREWQFEITKRGKLAATHREHLEKLSAAIPKLGGAAALRSQLADCHPLTPAILSTLDSIRPYLEQEVSGELRHLISQILRWHRVSARKRKLETIAPPLRAVSLDPAFDTQQLLSLLAEVQVLQKCVATCPLAGELRDTISSSPVSDVSYFLEMCPYAIQQSRARQKSLIALANLSGQIDGKWVADCHQAIATGKSNSDRLNSLSNALPTLNAYVKFRDLATQLDSTILQAFTLIAEQGELLGSIPESSLAREASFAILMSRLAEQQSVLEDLVPAFRELGATSMEDTSSAIEFLRSSHYLAAQIDACPLARPLRSAVMTGDQQSVVLALKSLRARIQKAKATKYSLDCLNGLQQWMTGQWTEKTARNIQADISNQPRIEQLIAAMPHMRAYQVFRARSNALSELHFKVFRILSGIRAELSPTLATPGSGGLGQSIRNIIRREILLSWKMQIESRNPDLLVNRQVIAAKVTNLQQLDQKLRELTRKRIGTAPIDAVAPIGQWEDITRLSGPRARRLREFFDLGRALGLLALRPVWMMTPDVASQLLPLEKCIFDIVVFDEASQMPVEYALPSLYRSKACVVSGDEKQMPPSAFFSTRIASDESEWTNEDELDEYASEQERKIQEQAWNRREVKDCPDLLHLSLASLPQTTLQIHYRSAFRELIGYSNAAFYRNELGVPVRHPDDLVRKNRPIEYIAVGGIYEDQQNQEEAARVVEVLATIWQEAQSKRPSIGIVTFNLKQAELIDELLEARAEEDEAFREIYAAELDRKDNGEDMSLFVKNVENVQGDERDFILFSTTFGRTRGGLFRKSFGVLGQAGGERRLNVAVTRARRKVIVIGSMPIDEISDMLRTRRPPESPRDYLQAYLHYATLVSNGQLEESRRLVQRIDQNKVVSPVEETQFDSLKQSVAQFVRSLGHDPLITSDDPVLGVDFSIRNPETGEFGMAIECDSPQHRLITRARAREIWRPSILSKVYPIVHQISAYAWYHTPQEERDRLRQQFDRAFPKAGVKR